MPSIPVYNQEATDDLNRAKRRIVEAEKMGIARLTTKPAVDETNGKADDLAELLINKLNDLVGAFQSQLSIESIEPQYISVELMVNKTRDMILLTRISRRVLRLVNQFVPIIQFTDLEKITTLRSLVDELGDPNTDGTLTNRIFDLIAEKLTTAFDNLDAEERSQYSRATDSVVDDLANVFGGADDLDDDELSLMSVPTNLEEELDEGELGQIRNLYRDIARNMARNREARDDDESSFGSTLNPASVQSRQRRARAVKKKFTPKDFINIIRKLFDNMDKIYKTLQQAFYNFNQFRQQQLPQDEEQARDADQEEVFEGKGRFKLPDKKKVYSVGNKVLDAMYAIEGLPKFL